VLVGSGGNNTVGSEATGREAKGKTRGRSRGLQNVGRAEQAGAQGAFSVGQVL